MIDLNLLFCFVGFKQSSVNIANHLSHSGQLDDDDHDNDDGILFLLDLICNSKSLLCLFQFLILFIYFNWFLYICDKQATFLPVDCCYWPWLLSPQFRVLYAACHQMSRYSISPPSVVLVGLGDDQFGITFSKLCPTLLLALIQLL